MKHRKAEVRRSTLRRVRARSALSRRRMRDGFTLLEMLVVMGILTVLIAILVPALTSVRATVKALHCASNMRSIVLEFETFAEGTSAAGQGDSESLGAHRFRINDFQDNLYSLDEFWDGGSAREGELKAGTDMMLCPAGVTRLTKQRGLPCSSAAIQPASGVSVAVNMRLYRPVIEFKGRKLLAPAASASVRANILHHPYVPLIMDVDGEDIVHRGFEPFYAAPPLEDTSDPYSTGRFWAPSTRHRGKTNVAFVGGHVLSSTHPERERWNWAYQADVGR